jgi:hypothetical protein
MRNYKVIHCHNFFLLKINHELVQITGQLADCRSLHGFKSSFAFVPVQLDVLGVYAGTWVDKI